MSFNKEIELSDVDGLLSCDYHRRCQKRRINDVSDTSSDVNNRTSSGITAALGSKSTIYLKAVPEKKMTVQVLKSVALLKWEEAAKVL